MFKTIQTLLTSCESSPSYPYQALFRAEQSYMLTDWVAARGQHVTVEHVNVRLYSTLISMRSQVVRMLIQKTVRLLFIRQTEPQNGQ